MIHRFFFRLVSFFRSGRVEADLAREITAHLQLLEDTFIAQGMSADDARYAARRAFGGVEQTKERQRDARSFQWLAGWPMDLKLGARMLVKSPGLTLVAVLALSVAIGGGAAYLELVNDLYGQTLPMKDGDRIVGIRNWDASSGNPDGRSLHDFALWRHALESVEDLGAHQPLERNLITEDGRTEPVRGVEISASAFRLVPTPALIGRGLVEDDERPAAPPVVVLGHALWQARFNGDPGVVGRTIRFGNASHTVVGVMPAGFGFPSNHSLWGPLRLQGSDFSRGKGPAIKVFGRLAPGVGLEAAQAELTALALRVAADSPDSNQHLRPVIKPYLSSLRSANPDGQLEMVLLYSVNLFFLGLLGICGANVATLVFARTATREGEITVRTALGASRGRIIAQLFAEALVLASLAAVVGLAVASFAVRRMSAWIAAQEGVQLPFWWNDRLAPETVLYAGVLALLAAAIVGSVPALKATGPRMQARLTHAAAGGSGMKFGGLWTGVIIGQVALTVIFLLSVVSLTWNVSTGRKSATDLIFPANEYLSVRLEMEPDVTPTAQTAAAQAELRARFQATYRELERRLEREPGVAGVTYATHLPGMGHSEFWVEMDGVPPPPGSGYPLWVRSTSVVADFFDTFNAPIVLGRGFNPGDAEADRPVVIVDQTFVKTILGGRYPIGQRVRHQQNSEHPKPGPWYEIVGVVNDLSRAPDKITEDAVLYRPAAPSDASPIKMVVHVRGQASSWTQRVRTIAAAADSTVRLYDLMPLDELHRSDLRAHAILARGLAIVGAVAVLLTTAGVYSLMSFTLARRRREIGIRAALGASPRRIVAAIFSRTFIQVGLGVLAGSVPGSVLVAMGAPEVGRGGGAAVAVAATATVATFIVGIALLACVVPARRALRIHPTEALRAD